MKKILVAVDGSDHSDKALEVAAALAKQNDASITVAHVANDRAVPPDLQSWMESEYSVDIERRLKTLNLQPPQPDDPLFAKNLLLQGSSVAKIVNTLAGESTMKQAMKHLREQDVASVDSLLLVGDPAETLLEACENHDIDTVVMGCRGVGKLRGMLMGSVSQAVAHGADCSVIIVK